MDKTVRKVTDLAEQQAETYRYWRSRPSAERFEATWELSRDLYREFYRHNTGGLASSNDFAGFLRGIAAPADRRNIFIPVSSR